ncbi:hypothetical protein BGZ91_011485 [Linnemannia elongata]|nr:hypothetical protein BGZ91_011485 [Linnemannia elongata]
MYSGRDISYSLSDTNLPDKRSKRDLVADWLDQQTFVTPSDMVEAPEHLPLVQDGPNSNIADDNEPLHQIHHHHNAHHNQRQQQQQSKSFPAELDANQLYHQQSINNTGAQREPRHQQQGQQEQGQEHYPRVIQRTNELYPGSRSSLYLASSANSSFLPTNIVLNTNTTPNNNIFPTHNTLIQLTMVTTNRIYPRLLLLRLITLHMSPLDMRIWTNRMPTTVGRCR